MAIKRRAFIAGAAGLAAARTATVKAQSSEPLRIGWMQALTGPNSAPGVAFDRGINFAVGEINATGGVNGRKIELITRDTQGDPTRAVNAAQELISRLKVNAIIGPSNSGETLAVTPIIARSKTPQIHAGVVDELINTTKYPNAYRTGASNSQWEAAASRYVVDILKSRQVAVIGDSTGYGTSAVQDSVADLGKGAAKVSYSGLVDLTAPDLTADLIRARNAGSTAILAWSSSAGLIARLLNARGDLGWDVPVAGHPALGSGEVQHLLTKPAYWDKVYQVGFRTCSYGPDGKLPPPQAAFVAKLAGKVELKDTTLWWVAWGYDAVTLIADAVRATNAVTRAAIIGHLNTVHGYPGIFGHYNFSPADHNGYPDDEVVMSAANSFRDGAFTIAPGY